MKFRTEIPTVPREPKINYSSKLVLIGSCFVENIGNKLEYFQFQNLRNPFGILFHPEAIQNLISKAADTYKYTEEDIFYLHEQWHCFDAHSDLNTTSAEDLVNSLNQQLFLTRKSLQEATHVIITPGTSWGYKNNSTSRIVANCHKVPQKEFSKVLSTVQQIEDSLHKMVQDLYKINPGLAIIFTVSPVRHLKDGMVENQRSKSHLLAAVHNIQEREDLSGRDLSYFPSYEMVMDDLRDYRYYSDDMIHPNNFAVNYIWEKFSETWLGKETISVMKEIDNIRKNLQHKPFNSSSEANKKFQSEISFSIENLKIRFPHIKF